MRIYAISDIHVDFSYNMEWLRNLSAQRYLEDTLLLAGDVAHEMSVIEAAFAVLQRKFNKVFFVPGNHDLWVLRSPYQDSVEKFLKLRERCLEMGIKTSPETVETRSGEVRIVPLFSWYTTPEEGEDSLFLTKKGEDPNLDMWSDFHFTRWPELPTGMNPTQYFLRFNEPHLRTTDESPVISFSHFLPRTDLILPTKEEETAGEPFVDPNPSFNFSRVAGSWDLDRQVRLLGSKIHVYGHQHRNRDREVEGVRYISYCLGYGRERGEGFVDDLVPGPKLVWE